MSNGNHLRSVRGRKITADVFSALAKAAMDRRPVSGWTHNFYRYPARFSPLFAATAIECFSRPSEIVLDPYMGGGTTIVEGVAAGRRVVGNDLNALATFVTKVKTTLLSPNEERSINRWAIQKVPRFGYHQSSERLMGFIDPDKTRNMTLPRARFIKKVLAGALASIEDLPSDNSKNFVRCIVLRVGQWALDGRERHTSLTDFRDKLISTSEEMLESIRTFGKRIKSAGGAVSLLNMDSCQIDHASILDARGQKVSLVVTSPPYPGVHVLYHRWQVDGRRETPAAYWISGCSDGRGASFYNFGDRREAAADTYFQTSLTTLQAIRRVMQDGGYIVQMLAFNRPNDQLSRYLDNMEKAGFSEVQVGDTRIWREVPRRKWHTAFIGKSHSSNEVVLVHRAI